MKLNCCLLALGVCALLGALPARAVQIIAHRGASHDAPENTLSSFRLGYAQGADADECDIYLTTDDKIIISHDSTTARTGNISNNIPASSSVELRKINVGDWGKWRGRGYHEKLPFLDEVLPLIPDGKRLFIEIKSGPEIVPVLKQVLARSGKLPEQTPVISFNYESAKAAKTQMPELQVYFLSGAGHDKKYPPIDELIARAKAANLDGLDLEQGFPIDAAFVKKVHDAGLRLYTWTVDDPAVARRQADAGVDGITTNRPQFLREQLGLNR